jgi:AraC-like DNA-binding protein
LAPDQAPVQLIAKQLGFRDQRRFATWFRRQSAMSPTEFRKARPV